MRADCRQGASRTDILVALAVALVAAVITLGVVMHARRTARSVQTRENMRVLGTALHSYHDAHRSFPRVEKPAR
jgi:type II secretory pathway pseudopilin PulG